MKINEVIFSGNMGQGIILKNNERLEFEAITVKVAGQLVVPNEKTTLSGYFTKPLMYCGLLKDNMLVFYLGEEVSLFETVRYYQTIHLIAETRLFSMFSYIAGRDFNFIKGVWK